MDRPLLFPGLKSGACDLPCQVQFEPHSGVIQQHNARQLERMAGMQNASHIFFDWSWFVLETGALSGLLLLWHVSRRRKQKYRRLKAHRAGH